MTTFHLNPALKRLTRGHLPRYLLLLLLAALALPGWIYLNVRPSYALYKKLEAEQVSNSLDFIAENPTAKYVLFRQLQGAGFNNQAQEILLFHHLALSSNRVYVYQTFIWRPRGETATVPLSAFLAGPATDTIHKTTFEVACPASETVHVQLWTGNYGTQWDHSVEVLKRRKEKCIIVDDWIMNWGFLGSSTALHGIWPGFKDYLGRHFAWSDQIMHIANRASTRLKLRKKYNSPEGDPYMALHFRRGDFEGHCFGLADDRVGFTTWATLPIFQPPSPNVFPPSLDLNNKTNVMDHCYPSLERVVQVIDFHAKARPHLRTIHILHDGAWDHPLVYHQRYLLESMLRDPIRRQIWGEPEGSTTKMRVTHSGMLPIKFGEADWSVNVDVELARRAELFIGIGYSSLSTQVLALKLGADGGRVEDISFV